jgi:hypothetical protein
MSDDVRDPDKASPADEESHLATAHFRRSAVPSEADEPARTAEESRARPTRTAASVRTSDLGLKVTSSPTLAPSPRRDRAFDLNGEGMASPASGYGNDL